MEKPYVICHMMTSVDGRIDCAMTEHLPGVSEYYDTLDALDAPTRVSGRVTALLELAQPGEFSCRTAAPLGKEGFFKAQDAAGYEVFGTVSARRKAARCSSSRANGFPANTSPIWKRSAFPGSPAAKSASTCPVPARCFARRSAWSAWPSWAADTSTRASSPPGCSTR